MHRDFWQQFGFPNAWLSSLTKIRNQSALRSSVLSFYNPRVPLKTAIAVLLGIALFAGCTRPPSEEKVSHQNTLGSGSQWLRSDYDIVGREVKEFNDRSGKYVLLTIKHGDKRITAQCGVTWRSTIGEEFPSTQVPYDNCSDLPMGSVKLERTDWNQLYYFAGTGKNTEEIVLDVKKVESHQ